MKPRHLPLLCFLSAGCMAQETFRTPPPPNFGYQIQMKPVTIAPGEDHEYCVYFNLDLPDRVRAQGRELYVKDIIANGVDPEAQDIAVDQIDVVGAPGLHHIQLLKLENDVDDTDNRNILDCAIDLFGGPLTGSSDPIFFTQKTNYAVSYSPGIARLLSRVQDKDNPNQTRGAQLLYNFHYVNATTKPITAEVVVNLRTVDRASVQHPVRSAWWNYLYFNDKAGRTNGIDAHGSFLLDVALVGVTSHQHRTGTLFRYSRADGSMFYENKNWAEPSYFPFADETILPKGEPLNFRCEWTNMTQSNIFFGLRAQDEMCTGIIEYYPVREDEADSILAMQRAENKGHENNPFRTPVTLEDFVGIPDDVLQAIEMNPNHAFDILDHDIMCGIAINIKEMEMQYGMASALISLQSLVDFLAPICRI